jgi:hypothetical protein
MGDGGLYYSAEDQLAKAIFLACGWTGREKKGFSRKEVRGTLF